jgi:hypothetical protein
VTQHASLSAERWATFTSDQRLLMIANELHRGSKLMAPDRDHSRRLSYERSLNLTDLTIGVTTRRGLRRELLRWRDLVARLYIGPPDPPRHAAALRSLLLLSPAGVAQLRALARSSPPERGADLSRPSA